MSAKSEVRAISGPICQFYAGKSIFITGTSGLLGTLILEVLLRQLPGINRIYILLRPKNGLDPKARKDIIFKKWYFRKMLEENPRIADKVHVVSGDVSQPDLGMSSEDLAEVANKVSIVFHVAGVIKFFKPYRYLAIHNSLGVKYVIDFCRKISNLEALVYTSTAYSNSNQSSEFPIKEIVYRLPFTAERYLRVLENCDEDEFEKLVSLCTPRWPNGYVLSKALAENVLNDMAADLPIAIIRPSVVTPTWKGSLPGYVEEGSGIVDLSVAIGKGFARILHLNPDSSLDFIPGDIVANTHVVAAWSIATHRFKSPLIVNCTGGHILEVKFQYLCDIMIDLVERVMLPKTFQKPYVKIVQNKWLCYLYLAYEHYIPAYFIDTYMFITRKKFRILPLYALFMNRLSQMSYFLTQTFKFDVDNYNKLWTEMDSKEKEIFYSDATDLKILDVVNNMPTSVPLFDWSIDKLTPDERKKLVQKRTRIINFCKRFTLLMFCYLIYLIIRLFI